MSTIYTLNGKVLKNAANDKWLIKAPPPIVYPVTIGSQIWSSKNLAVDDGLGGIYTQTVNYGQGDVVEYYYTWDAAIRVAATVQGWHLPSKDEWGTLATTAGGESKAGRKLKATYGWTAGEKYDNYGFTGLPAGWYNTSSSQIGQFGTYAYFWSVDEYSSSQAWARYLNTTSDFKNTTGNKVVGYSVRLIKDSE